MNQIKNKELIQLLKKNNINSGVVSKCKTIYRPLICPFPEIMKLIDSGSSIFDIGCGSGQFLLLMASYKNPSKLGGTEIQNNLVQSAVQMLKKYNNIALDISKYDGETIPKTVAEYDYVTLIDIIHHLTFDKQFDFLKSIISEMQVGERLILKDIDRSSPLVIGNKLHDLVISREKTYEIKINTAQKYLQDLNMQIEYKKTITTLWYPHYIILANKKHS